jgi:ADP-ribosylglycohydrolase
MLGAIAGDIIGSAYRRRPPPRIEFPLFTATSRFTGGTVLTVATAHAVMTGMPYAQVFRQAAGRHPAAGYGPAFRDWLTRADLDHLTGRGNGSARRVIPIGLAAESLDQVLREARRSAVTTHNDPEGIRGAQAVAMAVFLARTGASKASIQRTVTERIGYDLSRPIAAIRPGYRFDASCDGSVPEAITAFLESESVEGAIRLAVSLGGDADAQASIAGGVAEAFFGVLPGWLAAEVFERIPPGLQATVREFLVRYAVPSGRGSGS